jgi:hypothetical protein
LGINAVIRSTTSSVFAGRLLNRDALGPLVGEPRAKMLVLHRVDDLTDILDPNRRTIFVGDDDVAELRRVEQLIVGVERDRLVFALDFALRVADCRVDQRSAHVFEADPLSGQGSRVDLDAGGVSRRAEHGDLSDAGLGRKLVGYDVVGVIVDLVRRHRIGMDGIDQDREIRRVHFAVGRRCGHALRQHAGCRIDRLLHVGRRRIDAARQVELQRDRGNADAAE